VTGGWPLDLVALVADKDIQQVLLGLLEKRQQSLGIALGTWQVNVHPRHDPGVLREADQVLHSMSGLARHALVVLDHEGSGRDATLAADLERDLTQRLAGSGWGDRAAALVIEPEVEVWVWSDSPKVDEALGWTEPGKLRPWLAQRGLLPAGATKPPQPKAAFDEAIAHAKLRRSSAIFRELAENVGLERCTDATFARLSTTLRAWFSAKA